MSIQLASNSYGKSNVRMMKVNRDGGGDSVIDLNVSIQLEGDFTAAHLDGDNRNLLPTDTMKNLVYALGKNHPIDSIESFALHLADHVITTHRPTANVRVSIQETPWNTIHPGVNAFMKSGAERRMCNAVASRNETRVRGGIAELVILKTSDSAFAGFHRDAFTTLRDTHDRLLGTSLSAEWQYRDSSIQFAVSRDAIRHALLSAFATHQSASVQHTLHAMGNAALQACAEIDQIELIMPNKHCLLVDLSPFGLENHNEIFVPVEEPFGLIRATLKRT